MKSIFSWILRNAWNLFGVIGVVGTFYFSLAYVPDYVKEINAGKVNVIHESLMNDIQELLFYDQEISVEDIEFFIKGEELKQGASYPYNTEELLVQIQERFMGNKFIPLEKRQLLLQKIKTIRSNYSPPETPKEKQFNWVPILSWLFSGLGVAIAVAGATSIVRKLKIDKETEVDIVSGNSVVINQYHSVMTEAALEYEKMVGDVLSELGVLKSSASSMSDIGYDFLAGSKGKEVIVEVKRYRKLLGLGTAREFIYKVIESGKGGILVVASGVTQRTKELINEHNRITDNQKIFVVVGDSKETVKKQLAKFFEM